MATTISQIKTHPVILSVVQDLATKELDKQQIPFFKNDFEEFFTKYPTLQQVKKPDGKIAHPFSIHHFPHLTLEMCRELRAYVEQHRERILSTKSSIMKEMKGMYEFLTPDILSTESMDTTEIQQFDIDHEEALEYPFIKKIMLKNPPYYNSLRYGFPKIPVKVRNMPPHHQNRLTHKNANGDCALELLCGQNSYRDTSTPIFNMQNEIPEIDYEELIAEFPQMRCRNLDETMAKGEPTQSQTPKTPIVLPPSNEIVPYILDHLDTTRANDYKKWFAVLCSIYNCFEDKEEACKVAQTWSKKSSKYSDAKWTGYGKDRQMFLRLYDSRNGFHTLRYYLKQDNIEIYKEIFRTKASTIEANPYISRLEKNMIFKFSEKTVADLFAHLPISKNYIFCDEFFEFNGVLYQPELSLGHRIYEMIEPILTNYLCDLEKDDKDDKKIYKDLQKYVKDIGKTSFLNGVKKQLKYYLKDKDFKNKLDTNLNVLAFDDCVYDLSIQNFRLSTPQDLISKSVGYNRPKSNLEIRKELQQFFKSMFEEQDVYDYMRALNACCLFRGNVNNLFPIWTGRGSNGKSSFMNLKQRALGGYSITLPVSVLTTTVKNHATSDLPMTRGCRHVRCDEPTAKIRIQSNTIKVMTGGDPITCRGLYKESITFTVSAVFELLSNAMPLMDCYDYAVGRRLAPIPYTKQFLNSQTKEPYDASNKNHRFRDETLKDKLEMEAYYKEYLLMMLDDYLEFFVKKEVMPTAPPSIVNTALQYEEDNTESQDISGWFHSTYAFVEKEEYEKDILNCRKRYGKSMRQILVDYRRDTKDSNMDDRQFQLAFRELEGYQNALKYKNSVIYYLVKSKGYEEEEHQTQPSYHMQTSSKTVPL